MSLSRRSGASAYSAIFKPVVNPLSMGYLPFERRDKTIIVRTQASTSPKYGKPPSARTTDELIQSGIIIIDKPEGPSSHQVSAYVKQILKLEKTGHSGTLDPGVTGVLPTALGTGTRIVQSLLPAGKEYVCLMHVHQVVPEEKLRATLAQFVGKIKQMPPIKSAVKRQWRYRKVYYLEVLDIQGQDVLFVCGVQAGTYIRKLCHDIGEALGTGAHMGELRRTKAAGFVEKQAVTLQDVSDALYYYKQEHNEMPIRKMLLPIEAGVSHLAKIWVQDSTVDALCNGMQLKIPGIVKLDSDIQAEDLVAVMTLKDELVLVGKALIPSRQMLSDKGIAVKTEQVFLKTGTYPKQTRSEPKVRK
jgi:H/ACA ribonucleoprotein complex subunit 4